MRRIMLLATVALVLAAMMVAMAMPAFAKQDKKSKEFYCFRYTPFLEEQHVDKKKEVKALEAEGYICVEDPE